MQVAMADAGRLDLHEHLARTRGVELNRLDAQRLAALPQNGGANFHKRFSNWSIGVLGY